MHFPAHLRAFRAIEILEHIGTLQARQLLESLARRVPGAGFPVQGGSQASKNGMAR